jgi:hypothetical protein
MKQIQSWLENLREEPFERCMYRWKATGCEDMDWIQLVQAGSCEHNNLSLDFIKGRQCLGYFRYYQLPIKNSSL